MAETLAKNLARSVSGGYLPPGMRPSGELTSRKRSPMERINDLLAANWYGDNREGYQQASRLTNVAQTLAPPLAAAEGMYGAGSEAGRGNYATAGISLGMAGLPLPVKKSFKYKGTIKDFIDEGFIKPSDNLTQSFAPLASFNGKDIKASQATVDKSSFNYWRKRIMAGERPSVLLTQQADGTYKITDGHSRATAYSDLKVADIPVVIKMKAESK